MYLVAQSISHIIKNAHSFLILPPSMLARGAFQKLPRNRVEVLSMNEQPSIDNLLAPKAPASGRKASGGVALQIGDDWLAHSNMGQVQRRRRQGPASFPPWISEFHFSGIAFSCLFSLFLKHLHILSYNDGPLTDRPKRYEVSIL